MLKKIREWLYYPAKKPYKPNYVRPFVWMILFGLLVFGLIQWYYGSMRQQGEEGLQVDWATGLEISWKRIDLPPEQLERVKTLIREAEYKSSGPSGSMQPGPTTFVLTGGGQSRSFTVNRDTLYIEYPEQQAIHGFTVAPELEELILTLFSESFNDK